MQLTSLGCDLSFVCLFVVASGIALEPYISFHSTNAGVVCTHVESQSVLKNLAGGALPAFVEMLLRTSERSNCRTISCRRISTLESVNTQVVIIQKLESSLDMSCTTRPSSYCGHG
jgi:hypothetical protein